MLPALTRETHGTGFFSTRVDKGIQATVWSEVNLVQVKALLQRNKIN